MAAAGVAKASLESSDAAERARQFDRDGFVVSRRMFSPDEMRDLIAECQSFEGKSDERNSNDAGQMRFYGELFRKSEPIRRFISQRTLIDFLMPIAGPDLWVRWDQAVSKGPQSGVFDWHTDNGYDLLPHPHYEVWVALSDNHEDNGGLCVIPGSHKRRHRHRRVGTHMVAVGSERFDAADSGKRFIRAEIGDVVLFSSLLLHKTYENVTSRARWAYVAEVLKLSDFDPTIKAPYFVLARDGRPAAEFVESLPCARDPSQILKTLPLALRHRVGGPLVRRLRAALKAPLSP